MYRLLYAVFVASSEQATISELAQTLQADLPQLEAAVSLASRLGWAKKVLDPASLLNDFLVPGSPHSEDSAADDGFRSFSSLPPSPFQEGMPEADGDVVKSQPGITRFALMVDANLTSYLMMGSLSPGKFQSTCNILVCSNLRVRIHVSILSGSDLSWGL